MDELASTLSLCRRAGKLAMGSDMVRQAVERRRAHLVLAASDISARTIKELRSICAPAMIPVQVLQYTLNEIWYLTGKKAGVLAITDAGLAGKLQGLLQREKREEPNI